MPKVVDHAARRESIVQAVTHVIERNGFERLTMRELASELGYAHGALNRYFPNKQAVLTASFVHLHDQADARISRVVTGRRGLDALEAMCREILPFGDFGRRAATVVLAFWARAAQDSEIGQIHHAHNMRWRNRMRQFLLQAREDGELREDIDIDSAVSELAVRNAGWQMQASLMGSESSDETIAQSLTAHIGSLRSETAAPGTDGSGTA